MMLRWYFFLNKKIWKIFLIINWIFINLKKFENKNLGPQLFFLSHAQVRGRQNSIESSKFDHVSIFYS